MAGNVLLKQARIPLSRRPVDMYVDTAAPTPYVCMHICMHNFLGQHRDIFPPPDAKTRQGDGGEETVQALHDATRTCSQALSSSAKPKRVQVWGYYCYFFPLFPARSPRSPRMGEHLCGLSRWSRAAAAIARGYTAPVE